MKLLFSAAALSAFASAASGQTSEPGRVSLTIYNSDPALVQERRTLNLPAGRTRIEFKGVSAAAHGDGAVDADGFRIRSESRRHTTKGRDPLWTLALAPGARETVRYSYDEDD